ncbi:MAG: BMP family ABC transporter substrate-binding protein [Oscillospiraceae bacterium]|nr:BMP family ABC transporter substrate-binding protein [Oscillospiraceae bacterium]
MKKFLALLLALVMVFALAACGEAETTTSDAPASEAPEDGTVSEAPEGDGTVAGIPLDQIKVGFIFLHDENSTYDLNFINAAKAACEALGLTEDQYVLRTNVPEGQECYDAAAELADDGCNIVFADSFGHEDFMIQAAREFPEVQFCHATGTKAHTEGLDNYHNAFASIYEGRYLAGIAAGMKLNEMIEAGEITADQAKMGYVGAFTYAEVISGYTSFYLGAKSVCPSVTMDVTFTGSWYDETAEKEAANKLIAEGCVLISQHADSMGAPTACEEAGVPNVSYNGSTLDACPNTFIVSSRIDWEPYFEYMINCVVNGEAIAADWTGTLSTGSVVLTDVNEAAAAEGSAEAIETAKAALEDGSLHVFDVSTFTVGGETLTSYMADVDTDPDYTPDTEAIVDGYFSESTFRSAPYFDIQIDGINLLDSAF